MISIPAFLQRFTFRPRLLDHLSGYNRAALEKDIAAGITVGVVALPLAIAFGIASGVRPEQGIVTAVVAGFLISALGGSRVQIGGPAGAFVALLFGIVSRYGTANMLIATMMAGVLLFAMGAFRLGNLVRFIPVSIILGFTNGIAVIIGFSQLRDFLGLTIEKLPANFLSQVSVMAGALHTVNPWACLIGLSSLLLMVLWPVSHQPYESRWKRLLTKLPSTVLVLLLWSFLVWFFALPVETIGSRFGALPQGLPMPQAPQFDWKSAQNLAAPTIAIALLCAIESLLCARVADGLIQDRHDPNQELMAQGVANFVVPFFGGIAATGTIARTMTNARSGAVSPVAGMVHALTLFLLVLLAAPLAARIPLAALAAILLWVAFSMGEWRELSRLRQFSAFYRTTLLSTFILTVVFDLVVAIEVGLVLSSLFFIYRVSSLTKLEALPLPADVAQLPDGRRVAAYRAFGSLFFGSVDKLEQLIDPHHAQPDVLLLEMHQVINLDTTSLEVLVALYEQMAKKGGRLMVIGVNEQPHSLMQRSGFAAQLGAVNMPATLEQALDTLAS